VNRKISQNPDDINPIKIAQSPKHKISSPEKEQAEVTQSMRSDVTSASVIYT